MLFRVFFVIQTDYSELRKAPIRNEESINPRKDSTSVYAAHTATVAKSFCPPLPVTAHGHCPANYDILGMARQ